MSTGVSSDLWVMEQLMVDLLTSAGERSLGSVIFVMWRENPVQA